MNLYANLDLEKYAEWKEAVEGIKKLAETDLPSAEDIKRIGAQLVVRGGMSSYDFWSAKCNGAIELLRLPDVR